MSTTYPGSPLDVDPSTVPTITCPADSDPRNAASVNIGLQALADWVAFLFDSCPAVGSAARVRIWRASNGGTGVVTRFFVTSAGGFEITKGCDWDQPNNQWVADSGVVLSNGRAAGALRLALVGSSCILGIPLISGDPSPIVWSDSAWESLSLMGGQFRWLNSQSDPYGANPDHSTGLTNSVCAKLTCKAWASVAVGTTGDPLILDGVNFYGPFWDGVPGRIAGLFTINFSAGMTNSGKAVLVTPVGPLPSGVAYFSVETISETFINIGAYDSSNTLVNLTGKAFGLSIVVFGTQNS